MTDTADLLRGRCLFIPRMGGDSVSAFAAALESAGIEASAVPPSDAKTLELSGGHVSGDECFPLRVVLGDLLKVIETHGPDRVAFFMPTTCGPCRFGQYAHYIRQVLEKLGYGGVPILSPSSSNGYDGMNLDRNGLLRAGWRSMVTSEILHRMLLHIRPYERNPGETDAVYARCMEDLCGALRRPELKAGTQMEVLTETMKRSRDLLRAVPVVQKDLPVIGIVGEIFCRLNEFSNQDLLHRLEAYGAECWISGISEWLAYANMEQRTGLYQDGKRFSLEMVKAKLKHWIQHKDERALMEPFLDDLPEEADIGDLIDKGQPYLPHEGVIGEMVLSVGKAVYLWEKGASGVIDISPFSCMNGVVSQAVYPRVSDEHDRIPIRVFFFDQSQKDLDQDISIFMELVHTYRAKKETPAGKLYSCAK